jgi:hypothetical protein
VVDIKTVGRILLCACVVLSLAACVSQRTSAVNDSSKLQAKTVALTARPRAAFMAGTAGKSMFALIGVVAMEESGKAIVAENGIEDPAVTVRRDLLAAAEKHYGVIPASMPPVSIDTTDIAQLARAAKGADYLLDVQGCGQAFNPLTLNWAHYWINTMINVRVIDVPQAKLIGKGHCAVNNRDEPNLPTHDELLANNAARLKTILDAQSAQCTAQFKRDVLKIPD